MIVQIEIPDHIINEQLTQQDVLLELAIVLYDREMLSLRAAAKVAKIHWLVFEEVLAERKIDRKYKIEEFEEDLVGLKKRH